MHVSGSEIVPHAALPLSSPREVMQIMFTFPAITHEYRQPVQPDFSLKVGHPDLVGHKDTAGCSCGF